MVLRRGVEEKGWGAAWAIVGILRYLTVHNVFWYIEPHYKYFLSQLESASLLWGVLLQLSAKSNTLCALTVLRKLAPTQKYVFQLSDCCRGSCKIHVLEH